MLQCLAYFSGILRVALETLYLFDHSQIVTFVTPARSKLGVHILRL